MIIIFFSLSNGSSNRHSHQGNGRTMFAPTKKQHIYINCRGKLLFDKAHNNLRPRRPTFSSPCFKLISYFLFFALYILSNRQPPRYTLPLPFPFISAKGSITDILFFAVVTKHFTVPPVRGEGAICSGAISSTSDTLSQMIPA